MFSRLQYISQGKTLSDHQANIQEALDSGCSWIQLRIKNTTDKELLFIAEQVKSITQKYKATLIINDHPEVARAVDADGVHLGLQDMAVAAARNIIGKHKIIGGTANTFDDVMLRYNEGCSYVGVGPFRFTTTKEKLSPILGLEGIAAIITQMRQKGIELPLYAIGGILPGDIEDLVDAGAYGIAVSGVITHHANKKQVVQHLKDALYAKAIHS